MRHKPKCDECGKETIELFQKKTDSGIRWVCEEHNRRAKIRGTNIEATTPASRKYKYR